MSPYDVKVLFTSGPVDPALDMICGKLQQDPMLYTRTPSVHYIITLLEFCLNEYLLHIPR